MDEVHRAMRATMKFLYRALVVVLTVKDACSESFYTDTCYNRLIGFLE